MSKQLCVHTIYLALRVMGSDKEQKRAQDDCNFGYFSTRLALLWHEALAIPLIQVIFWSTCPSSFDGPHLFLGNNEQRAKKQRPGAGGTIFCQNILRTTHSEGKIIGLNSSRFYNLETSSNFDALRRCNDSKWYSEMNTKWCRLGSAWVPRLNWRWILDNWAKYEFGAVHWGRTILMRPPWADYEVQPSQGDSLLHSALCWMGVY